MYVVAIVNGRSGKGYEDVVIVEKVHGVRECVH